MASRSTAREWTAHQSTAGGRKPASIDTEGLGQQPACVGGDPRGFATFSVSPRFLSSAAPALFLQFPRWRPGAPCSRGWNAVPSANCRSYAEGVHAGSDFSGCKVRAGRGYRKWHHHPGHDQRTRRRRPTRLRNSCSFPRRVRATPCSRQSVLAGAKTAGVVRTRPGQHGRASTAGPARPGQHGRARGAGCACPR